MPSGVPFIPAMAGLEFGCVGGESQNRNAPIFWAQDVFKRTSCSVLRLAPKSGLQVSAKIKRMRWCPILAELEHMQRAGSTTGKQLCNFRPSIPERFVRLSIGEEDQGCPISHFQ
jgi:hypothetical protein